MRDVLESSERGMPSQFLVWSPASKGIALSKGSFETLHASPSAVFGADVRSVQSRYAHTHWWVTERFRDVPSTVLDEF